MNKKEKSNMPLVISPMGGLANEASIFYKRLAFVLVSKRTHLQQHFMQASLLSGFLLPTLYAIKFIIGAQSSCGHSIKQSTYSSYISLHV